MKASFTAGKVKGVSCLIICTCMASLLSCANPPSAPEFIDYIPAIHAITLFGDTPAGKIAAGSTVTLQVETSHPGGEALTFEFEGPGEFSQINNEDHSVQWEIPIDAAGSLEITCTVTDENDDQATMDEDFAVGRLITSSSYGDVVSDQITWNSSDSPFYILSGFVEIPDGVTLMIEEDVTIYCKSNSRLKVRDLICAGTQGHNVTFLAFSNDTEVKSFWYGIELLSGSTTMDYTTIRNSNHGLYSPTGGVSVDIGQGCYFAYNFTGLEIFNSTVDIYSSAFDHCNFGARFNACELSVEFGTFIYAIDAAVVISGASEGSLLQSSFRDNTGNNITITGRSYVEFHDNDFFGENVVFIFGSGYSLADPPIQAQCNYWGNTTVPVVDRLEWDEYGASVDYTPTQISSGAECNPDD